IAAVRRRRAATAAPRHCHEQKRQRRSRPVHAHTIARLELVIKTTETGRFAASDAASDDVSQVHPRSTRFILEQVAAGGGIICSVRGRTLTAAVAATIGMAIGCGK